jgi:hypothetical protein
MATKLSPSDVKKIRENVSIMTMLQQDIVSALFPVLRPENVDAGTVEAIHWVTTPLHFYRNDVEFRDALDSILTGLFELLKLPRVATAQDLRDYMDGLEERATKLLGELRRAAPVRKATRVAGR